MAKGFNLTAQINLVGPTNLKPIVADIKRELGSVDTSVQIKLDGRSSKSITTVTKRLQALNDILVTAKNSTDSLNASLASLSSSLSTIGGSSGKVSVSMKNTASSTSEVAKNIKQATTEMEEFGKQSALAIRRFAAFSVVSTAIYGFINAINSGFKSFIAFDKELIKLQQVTAKGATGISFLEKTITELSTQLGVSSESLLMVASTLAQAGLSAEETRIALAALAKTELAPSFDNLIDTTEGAIAALRQFELQASELEGALGSINAVAAAFAVESKDIISAIQRTGGVFAAASKGVSEGTDALNEFIAIFTSVRQTTRESAETIATGLRTIFTRIQRGSTIEQLRNFGIELTDLEGKFVGPFEAIRRLSEGLKTLDPRDLRFSQIVEELGGFRQIGKVIPLIQQFATAQEALKIAQKGQGSLTEAQVTAQKSLANQIAKVREQFLALIRDVGKSSVFQGLFKLVTGLTSGLISLASAFKPILPILGIIGTIKGVKAIGEFGTGFFGGLKKGGGAKEVGTNVGSNISGAKEKEANDVRAKATTAIAENTSAIKTLTTAVNTLTNAINSRGPSTLKDGGKILGFNKGGMVPGNGGGDTVPAFLEGGEIVMNRKAVKKYGAGNLLGMNRYAKGGISKAVVSRVIDGDTLNVDITPSPDPFNTSATRLFGFDAYELNKGSDKEKKLGLKAKTLAEQYYPQGKDVTDIFTKKHLANTKRDKYGRYFYDDNEFGKKLIDQGLGVPYTGSGPRATKEIEKKYNGGIIQKFMDGSPGGIRVPSGKGRGQKIKKGARAPAEIPSVESFVKWAKGIYDEYDADPSLVMATDQSGMRAPPEILLANKILSQIAFETGGAGMSLGQRFVRTPKKLITPELQQFLITDPTDSNEMGFYEDVIGKFARVKAKSAKQVSKLGKEQALKAAEARQSVYTGAENAIAEFKKTGVLSVNPDILSYIQQSITNPDSLPLDRDDIENIKKKLTKPNMEAFSALVGPDKKPVGVQGQRTKLSEVFGTILETYGSDVGDLEIDNIIKAVGSKVQEKKLGGFIQKFQLGSKDGIQSIGSSSKTVSQILSTIDELGGAGRTRQLIGIPTIEKAIANIVSSSPVRARNIFDKDFLQKPIATPFLPTVSELLDQALIAFSKTSEADFRLTQEEIAAAKDVAIVGFKSNLTDLNPYYRKRKNKNPMKVHTGILQPDDYTDVEQLWKEYYESQMKAAANIAARRGQKATSISEQEQKTFGIANAQGYDVEMILAALGSSGGKRSSQDAVDFASGLSPLAASVFGVPAGIPTQAKLTVSSDSILAAIDGLVKMFAFGGKTDGPSFEEIKQQIIDKYPEIQFRISKRKRAWGYNLMGALKSEGGLSSGNNRFNFEQPGNLKQLQEYADKLASELMSPEQLAMGGLISNFASGGTIPAMVSNGEAFIPPSQAKKIGYAKLNKMNQADRNGMSGFAVGGGIFKGPGSGTSDSIGPIDLPVGGYVIREKAVKALKSRFNKGGAIGKIQKFIRGGIAQQHTERAQGSLIQDVKQAEKTFAMLMGQLGKNIRSSIINGFQGIESVGAGKRTSLGTTMKESARGQAVFGTKRGQDISLMGLQIMGKQAAATTETVAHEAGHLADYSLGNKKGYASKTEGTFQFQLIEKIKPVMEKAFIKAGEDSQRIANYLTKNEELFAEFFAKASPEVRAIITSTTDAQTGMKLLADHLGDIGYTYAGLEASDIDPTRAKPKKPATGSKILGALSAAQTKVKSFFTPTTTPKPPSGGPPGGGGGGGGGPPGGGGGGPPGGGGGGPPGPDLVKAAEQAEFFAYKAKQAGESVNQFGKSLATKVIDKAKDLQTNLANRKTGLRYDIIGKGGDLKGITDKDILKEARDNFIQQIKEIDPSMAAAEIEQAAQAIVNGLQQGLSLEDIIKSSTELTEVFNKTIDESESLEEAFKSVAKEAGMSAEALKSGIGPDKLRREQFIQSDAGKSFGPLAKLIPDKLEKLSKTGFGKNLTGLADKLSGKGLEDRLGKTLGSFGTVIGDKINKLGGPMVALGASMSILGNKLPTLLGSKYATSETAAGVAGAIGGAGQGLASGAVLGAQLAGPVGAMIGGISGAIINGISGAFEAFNQKKLENNLKALEKTSGDLEIALKKLQITTDQKSANAVKEAAMKDAQTLATTGEQAQFGTGGAARGWLETLRGIDPTGIINSITGGNQEKEARQAVVAGIERQLDAFGRLGERNLARSSADQVRAVMKQAEEAAAAAPGGPESEAGKQARTDVLARSNQTYQMMSREGFSEKDIFRGMAIVSRKQKGQDFEQDLQTPEGQAKLIEEGKKLAAVEAEGANKAKLLSDAMRDVNIQSDNLAEQFRKVQSYLERFGQEIEIIKNNANDTANALRGQASVRNTNRQSEQILGNISAYSTEEVNRVAEETAAIAGGGEGGKQIATQIKTAKVIQDELPRLLKGATGQNVGGVVDQLREIFKNATIDAPPELFNEIEKNLEEKVSGRQGTSLADLGSDFSGLEAISKSAAEGLKTAQAFQKQYNDALQVVIDLTNEYGKALNEATEWQLKAADISARSDLQLAETLGKNLSLSEKNRPQEQRIRGLTQGIMVGGTMDPEAIYRGMQESIRALGDAQAGTGLYGQREALRANMQRNPADAAAQKAYIDNENAIAKQTNTVNNARKALEELASDGTAAANALSLIQEQQKAASASVNFLQKVLTSDASELDKMNKGLAAYTKLVSGKATTRDINSLQFRQQAFGGLQELQGLIPDSIFGQMQARMSEAMIDAMPGGKEMLDRGTGALVPDGNGGMREMTFREAIRNKAQGKDPQQEKLIQAYYAAADRQQQAASILATAAMDVATTFKEAQTEALAKINEEIPNMMTKAQNETAGIPTPETAQAPKDAIFVLDENQLNALRDAATIKWGTPPSLGLDANLDKSISSLITAITALTTTIGVLAAAITGYAALQALQGKSGLMGGLGRMMGFGGKAGKAVASSADDATKAAASVADDAVKAAAKTAASGADDATKAAASVADDAVKAAAKTAASGADDAVEAAAKSAAKTATAGAAKTAVQGVDTTADVLKTADTALDMTKLAKVGTGLKMLGKILGPLDVIIGTYQGATSQSEQAQVNQENFGGVIGTGYNTAMGALTGSAETGVSTTGSLLGLEEKTALNNVLSLTEAGARGFTTAGLPGAVVGTGAETVKMSVEAGREGIGAIQASSAAAQQAQANLALDANQRQQQRKIGGAGGAPSIVASGLSALEANQASLEASMRTKVATGEMSQGELDKILMGQRESRRQELDASEWTFASTKIDDKRLDRSPEFIAAVEKLTASMLAAKEAEKTKTEVAKSAQDVPEKAQTQQAVEQSQLSQVSSVDQTTSSFNTLRDAAIELADILRNIKIPVPASVQTETPDSNMIAQNTTIDPNSEIPVNLGDQLSTFDDFANAGLQMGSIYTHDVTLEGLMNKLLDSYNQSDSSDIGSLISGAISPISDNTSSIIENAKQILDPKKLSSPIIGKVKHTTEFLTKNKPTLDPLSLSDSIVGGAKTIGDEAKGLFNKFFTKDPNNKEIPSSNENLLKQGQDLLSQFLPADMSKSLGSILDQFKTKELFGDLFSLAVPETPEQSCECKILAEILAELQKAKITGQTQPLVPTPQSAQTPQVDTPAEIRTRQERAAATTTSEQTALPQQPTSPGVEAKTSAETQTATKPESTPRTLEARKQAAKSQLADALKRKRYGKPLPGDDSVIEWGRSDLAKIKEEEKTENREQYLLSKDAKIREKYMTKTEKESGLATKLAEKEKSGLVVKKEKVLTPYQKAQQQKKEAYLAGKKAKREAYLSRLRPEIREKMLTKEERAERDAQNRPTPRTIPPGGMVAAATPGAERIEPSDPNVLKPQQESQVSATVGGLKPEVQVSQIQHTSPQLTPQQQEAINSAGIIGQQHKKDMDELRRRKAAGETLTQQERNALSVADSVQPAEEALSRRYGSPVSPQPVPSNLPKPVEYNRQVQNTENRGSLDGGASADKQAITGMGTAITVDPSATQFLGELQKTFNSFDQYINKLQGVAATIPSKIELSGNYQLQVQITGAAALEGLQKSMKDMAVALIEPRLEQLRNEVSAATGGTVKPTSSMGRGSKSTSDVNM